MLITVTQNESHDFIIATTSYESRFHCELLPVLGQVELLADGVQGRSHFRQRPRGRILALVTDPLTTSEDKREQEKGSSNTPKDVGKPDNWNAPACFSLCYFCLTHLNAKLDITNLHSQLSSPHCPLDFHICFPQLLAALLDPNDH